VFSIRASRVSGSRPASKLASAFLLLSLLTGLVEVHNHAAGAVPDLGGETRFTPEAIHPHLPHHVEPGGQEEETPSCPGCLHSLTTRGAQTTCVAVLRVETAGTRPPLEADRKPSGPCTHRGGGRSPPSA